MLSHLFSLVNTDPSSTLAFPTSCVTCGVAACSADGCAFCRMSSRKGCWSMIQQGINREGIRDDRVLHMAPVCVKVLMWSWDSFIRSLKLFPSFAIPPYRFRAHLLQSYNILSCLHHFSSSPKVPKHMWGSHRLQNLDFVIQACSVEHYINAWNQQQRLLWIWLTHTYNPKGWYIQKETSERVPWGNPCRSKGRFISKKDAELSAQFAICAHLLSLLWQNKWIGSPQLILLPWDKSDNPCWSLFWGRLFLVWGSCQSLVGHMVKPFLGKGDGAEDNFHLHIRRTWKRKRAWTLV